MESKIFFFGGTLGIWEVCLSTKFGFEIEQNTEFD